MELYILPFQENSPNIMYKDFNGGFKYKNNNFKLYINIYKNNNIYNCETSKIDASVQLHGITMHFVAQNEPNCSQCVSLWGQNGDIFILLKLSNKMPMFETI